MTDEGDLTQPQPHLLWVQLYSLGRTSLQKRIQIAVMVLNGLLLCLSAPHSNKIIRNHLNVIEALDQLMHSPLEYFRGRTNAEWHTVPAIPAKGCVECRQDRGGFIELYVPKSLADIEDSEELGPMQSSGDILDRWESIMLSLYGAIEVFGVKANM
jgi:hypothetical protein